MKLENKLKKRKHFAYIYKHGETRVAPNIQLFFINSKIKSYKVGFSVSKKIGKSVVRNKIKRRMRESFLKLEKFVLGNHNYIFMAREGIQNLKFEEIGEQIKKLLIKANVYVKENT